MGEEPALQSLRRKGRWGSPRVSSREAFGEQNEAHIEAHIGAYIENFKTWRKLILDLVKL